VFAGRGHCDAVTFSILQGKHYSESDGATLITRSSSGTYPDCQANFTIVQNQNYICQFNPKVIRISALYSDISHPQLFAM
jgi:hypothetical protein